ncbi:MAG: hypothetical protein ACRBCI_03820 [Cellvibrionaceae bacterium]
MIGHGERLLLMIQQRYSSVASCGIFMRKEGKEINEQQLYRIINGQWPSEKQLALICEHFEVEPECLLFGQCFTSRKHGYLMEALSPQMQKMAVALTHSVNDAVLNTLAEHDTPGRPAE